MWMAQPGKYSKVEVLRKYIVGISAVAGTTQIVGSGLKPQPEDRVLEDEAGPPRDWRSNRMFLMIRWYDASHNGPMCQICLPRYLGCVDQCDGKDDCRPVDSLSDPIVAVDSC